MLFLLFFNGMHHAGIKMGMEFLQCVSECPASAMPVFSDSDQDERHNQEKTGYSEYLNPHRVYSSISLSFILLNSQESIQTAERPETGPEYIVSTRSG
jgi:hypothetical protein